jgi:hypothetical protein
MAVTETLALETSANILTARFYPNVESSQIGVNLFGNARRYARGAGGEYFNKCDV